MRELSDADFTAFAQFLAREAGLVFDTSRRPGLSAVVAERLDVTGIESVPDYLAFVSRQDGTLERQRLLDGVTIQETHFYRNGAQIESLRLHLLPDLMRRCAAEGRPLRIWSAGCSTGEEPYTLAMLALEVRAALRLDVGIVIVGTDVSAAAVEVAERATYAGRTVDLAEDGALARWFDRAPGEAFRVRDEVRELVSFRVHNLITDEPPFPPGSLDLVVCRNVTIYFARETTRALVHRFHDVIRPNGYLLLGHAETLWQISDAFALVPVAEAFVYRKEAPVPVAAPTPAPRPATPAASTDGSATIVPVNRAPRPFPRRTRTRNGSSRVPPRAVRAADPIVSAAAAAVERATSELVNTRETTERATAHARSRSAGVDALIAARQAWAEGRYSNVVELSHRATHADPMLVDAYVLGGQASSTLGDDVGALDALRKAVYLEPSAGHAHFLLAGALARLGQPGPAARSFRAAAASLPLVSPEQLRFLLDGRDVQELVDLCDQLADASERIAAAAATAATPDPASVYRAGAPASDNGPLSGRSTR